MWCSSKKKPKCFPLLFKTKPQFELFVFPVSSILLCLLDESESLPAWRLSCESAPVFVSLCVCVPNKKLLSGLLNSTENFTWGRNEGYFTEIRKRVWQGIWSLDSTDPQNIFIKNIMFSVCGGYSFYEITFNLYFCCFQQVIIRVFMHCSGLEHGRGHNLRLQLFIS